MGSRVREDADGVSCSMASGESALRDGVEAFMMALRTSGVSDLPRMRGERRRAAGAEPAVRADMIAASGEGCNAREVRSASVIDDSRCYGCIRRRERNDCSSSSGDCVGVGDDSSAATNSRVKFLMRKEASGWLREDERGK